MMLKRAIPAVAIALAILIAWAFSAAQSPVPKPPPVARSQPVPLVPSAELGADYPHARIDVNAAPPRRIDIPAIGVSAPVIPLGLNHNRTIQTPRAWGDAGWYKPGPEPGELGPAVVVGHVDSKTGPAVFYRLRALHRGDLIRIARRDGTAVRFRVQRIERWPKSDFPTRRVYGPTHGAALRLVTCSGNFNQSTGHYVDNTIVYASRV